MTVKGWMSRSAWVVASLVVLGGCVGETSTDEAVDSGEEAVVGEEAAVGADPAAKPDAARERGTGAKDRAMFKGGRAHGPHGGPERLVGLALKELELTDAQRSALEEAMQSAHAPPGGDDADRKERAAALAAAIRAGKVDPAALGAGDEPADPHAERRAAAADALQVLHATLTPQQRADLVARARELEAEHDAMPGRDRDPKDRGPKDRDAQDRGPKEHGPMGKAWGPGPGDGGPLGHVLRDVPLRDEQRQQIEAALEAKGLGKPKAPPDDAQLEELRAAHEAARAALLDAFVKDRFDARKVLEANAPPKAQHAPPKLLEVLATVVPILDADQREALAQAIERGPGGGKPGKRGHGKR